MNPLALFGLMGLLGFLGILTGEAAYFGFFGFFVFFRYAIVRYDELFASYVKSSAASAFFCMAVLFTVSIAAVVLFHLQSAALTIFVLVCVLTIMAFIVRLLIFEFAESASAQGA
ncbi:MAG: DUF3796 domain-containing protein [Methanocorpusculum sp.]|nr:DUF3796 domain-containing protein [Methanocorpusculum sp.]